MTNPYRAALATRGAPGFVLAAFVGRLPISMVGLGTILLVHERTGSYGFAGAVAAFGALSEAVSAPVLGRALDRFGQARVLTGGVGVFVVALAGLVVAVRVDAPSPTWFLTAAGAGTAMPPVGACVRSRWTAKVGGTPLLASAFALESSIDEVVFVLGPSLVTFLAVAVSPSVGLVAAATFGTAGTLALVAQRSTDPGPAEPGRVAHAGMLRAGGTRLLMVVYLAVGSSFGALDVSMVAFSRAHGAAAAGGALLGLVAGGSCLSGLVYGARRHEGSPAGRFRLTLGCFGAGLCLPLAGANVAVMAPLAVCAGLTIAPALINGFGLVERLVDPAARTEGFAWLTTAVATGEAGGSPLAGRLIDLAGPRAGLLVTASSAVVAALIAQSGYRALSLPSTQEFPASGNTQPSAEAASER